MSAVQSWSGRLVITGIGLVIPVGLTAPTAVAALRAGISRIGDLPGFQVSGPGSDPVPATGALVPYLAGHRQGLQRLGRLGETALREAITSASLPPAARCALFLGTAAPQSAGRLLPQGPILADTLARLVPGVALTKLYEAGRAAALQAIRAAAAELVRKETPPDAAIVGGVDSLVSPLSLRDLHARGRLREGRRSTGVLPGEGAGFLVLERPESATRRGAKVIATLTAAAGDLDPTPAGKPTRAVALGRVLRALAAHITDPAPLLVSDLNGERSFACEWMFASARAPFCHAGMPHWLPSESIGDSGAVSGAVNLAWAATAFQRGYAPSTQAVIWGASDEGAREALVLGRA